MIALTRQGPQPAPQRGALPPSLTPAPAAVPVPASEENCADRAVRGSDKPLTRDQKTTLVILAKEAYQKLRLVNPSIASFDEWRVAEAIAACTRRIREARNSDYRTIRGRFRNHLGKAGLAFDDALNEGTSDQVIALHMLAKACKERGLALEYPAAICWKQFKRPLNEASAKQIWCLVFTVRNRRKPAKAPATPAKPGQKTRDYTLKSHQPKPNTEDPF